VKITTGKFRKHEGKVNMIDLKKTRVFVDGIELTKKDGTKKYIPLDPSNMMVIELNMDDKLRQKFLEVKNG
jgi:large subunit ribosomal protein L24